MLGKKLDEILKEMKKVDGMVFEALREAKLIPTAYNPDDPAEAQIALPKIGAHQSSIVKWLDNTRGSLITAQRDIRAARYSFEKMQPLVEAHFGRSRPKSMGKAQRKSLALRKKRKPMWD